MPVTEPSYTCVRCRGEVSNIYYDPHYGDHVCINCLPPCEGCGEQVVLYSDAMCRNCFVLRAWCTYCDTFELRDDMHYLGGELACSSCYERRCESCGDSMAEYDGLCSYCDEQREDDQIHYVEDFDYGIEDFTPYEFSFDRGRQRTSVEIEFGGDAEYIAQELNRQDLSPVARVGDYHSGMGRENNQCSYVEYDGSVYEGGELIVSRLGLPEQAEVKRLWDSLAVLRKAVREESCKLTMQCGVHIHVDVGRYDLPWVMSSAVVYNFLERVLYHIASANWKSHRSVRGNEYSKLTPKEIASPGRFREVFGYDRYYGLNASNYLHAIRNCECGNIETGSQCSCRRYKATLEYRLFNTTANPRKLHAYVALCQAITAYGRGKTLTAADLPAWEFNRTDKPNVEDAAEYAKRLMWLFENLPLSPEERNSIRYCLRHSGLAQVLEAGIGDTDMVHGILHADELLSIPEFIAPREDEDQLPPTYPSQSGTAFAGPVSLSSHTSGGRVGTWQDDNGRWRDNRGRYALNPYMTRFEEAAAAYRAIVLQDDVPAEVFPF